MTSARKKMSPTSSAEQRRASGNGKRSLLDPPEARPARTRNTAPPPVTNVFGVATLSELAGRAAARCRAAARRRPRDTAPTIHRMRRHESVSDAAAAAARTAEWPGRVASRGFGAPPAIKPSCARRLRASTGRRNGYPRRAGIASARGRNTPHSHASHHRHAWAGAPGVTALQRARLGGVDEPQREQHDKNERPARR